MPKIFFAGLFILIAAVSLAQTHDAFDTYIRQFMKADSVPGASFLVIKKGKVVKSASYGYSNLELKTPAKQGNVWELASVSKPITATAIMKLAEDGKLHLDSSVFSYLGNVVTEKYRTVTVRQLMSHISGLPSDHYVHTKLYAPSPLRYTVKEQLADLFKLQPAGKPGEQYLYSNAGFFLQAAIIEKVSGESFQSYVKRTVFDKAGMKQTYFLNGDSIVPNRSQVYTKRKNVWVRFSLETTLQALDANGFGGLASTTNDLNLFVQNLLAGKIISKEATRQMFAISKLNDGTEAGPRYSKIGLGWFVKQIEGKTCISHSGHTGTVLLFFPEQELTIVFLSNLSAGISMVGDRGYRVNDIGYELAAMAFKKFGTK